MITKIAITAGEIWIELDKSEGINLEDLLKRLENPARPKDLLLMAFGWLVYQKHIKWVPGINGGQLFFISPKTKEGLKSEKSDQNRFAVNNA